VLLDTTRALEAPDSPLGRLSVALQTVATKLQPKTGLGETVESLKWAFKEEEIERILASIEREKSLFKSSIREQFPKADPGDHRDFE
jgi:hypothetical protein